MTNLLQAIPRSQLEELFQKQKRKSQLLPRAWWPLVVVLILQQASALVAEQLDETSQHQSQPKLDKESTANHRMDPESLPLSSPLQQEAGSDASKKSTIARHSRQYDGPLSTSSSGNYAALASDSGAYVGNTGYSSGSAATGGLTAAYTTDPMSSNMYSGASSGGAYHDQLSLAARAAGYPQLHATAGYPSPMQSPPPPHSMSFGGPLASMFPPGALSAGFPLMAKGFDLAEIVCTAIAVAIGAVIVGAPFILLYLFVMNHMQGNGASAVGPSGGAISLTGPTSSTNVTGRKKRHTNLPEALFRQLSPLMNNEQLVQSFKMLINSLAKYQM